MGPIIYSLLALAVLWLFVARLLRRKLPLPPGPKPWPLIGNALDMPAIRPWETYREWSQKYDSDFIFVQLPMQPVVILGSVKAAIDLLEKRSQIYSSRTRSILIELMTWDFNFSLIPYSSRWRAHRRMFHQYFHRGVVNNYRPVQLQKVRECLPLILEAPKNTRHHVRRTITSIILSIAYGKNISSRAHDEYVALAQEAMEGLTQAVIPGAHLVEYLPFLQYIPGSSARKMVNQYLPYVSDMRNGLYREVKVAVESGTASASLSSLLIEEVRRKYGGTELEADYDEVAMNVASVLYSAASDSTVSTSEIFLLVMALYPNVQKKAQAELDRVLGPTALPNYDDLERLPYNRAVLMETLRWMPTGPFGIPHAVITDDTYKGCHIPKGAMIIPNVWAMMKNPDDYPDPDNFLPERFIDKDGNIDPQVRDPYTVAFGWGRRICPGRDFAMNALSIFMVSILQVFDITAGTDASGNPIKLTPEMVGGSIAKPREIPCGFTPRSAAAKRLIQEIVAEEAS